MSTCRHQFQTNNSPKVNTSFPESSESSVSVDVSMLFGDSSTGDVVTKRRALETICAATVGGGGLVGGVLVTLCLLEPIELAIVRRQRSTIN